MAEWEVQIGDCVELMRLLPDHTFDAVVTDPPYGLEFMGRDWDKLSGQPGYQERGRITDRPDAQVPYGRGGGVNSYQAGVPMQEWHERWATEAKRLLKPGGHLVAFGGTRTHHRLMVGIEDAGLEVRDCLSWLYGQGFPKSKNLGDGWGTALKPGWEPIVLARRPFRGSVETNVGEWGTGAINIDGCRIDGESGRWPPNVVLSHLPGCRVVGTRQVPAGTAYETDVERQGVTYFQGMRMLGREVTYADEGGLETIDAWECELDCPVLALDRQAGQLQSGTGAVKRESASDTGGNRGAALGAESRPAGTPMVEYGDVGGASRFFYQAKASASERSAGLDGRNEHPTVKPIEVMRWLLRLVCPPGGVVLDPFAGSGTTGCAAMLEPSVGRFVGMEQSTDYALMALRRIAWWSEHPDGMELNRRLELEKAASARREAGWDTLF
jgi:site-specific DNA-methyltransferase (adenine-specific)